MTQIYRTMLGRSPSADEVESQLMATTDWLVLLKAIASSDEHLQRQTPEIRRLTDAAPPLINIWRPELAEFGHASGTRSGDGEALIGKEGWVFLALGSNSVLDQYHSDFKLPSEWLPRWSEVVRTRRDEAKSLAASVVFLVVPDKLSVLSRFLPDDVLLDSPPPAAALSSELGVIYPVQRLSEVSDGAFLRTDTHLSLAGNAALSAVVVEAFGESGIRGLDPTLNTEKIVISGDLGQKFEPPAVEIVTALSSFGDAVIVDDNHAEIRAAGRHLGTCRVLRNSTARDRRTVVVFGDSYGFPAMHYQSLSWFLAQEFGEVHFIWSPFGWDPCYVERVGASLVVCETAERFVPRPPELRFELSELVSAATGG